MITIKIYMRLLLVLAVLGLGSCKENENIPEVKADDSFAKGADISWITEMEAAGVNFYNNGGVSVDGIKLLHSMGMDAVRLRVWVDPVNGWCNKQDLLVKAYRAHNLGMRILIDFHYSDSWADPGQQNKPRTWEGLSLDALKQAVADHTIEVLSLLKSNGITPEWVQVGNETGNGMLWDEGKASENMANYALLNNAGYDAVKSVFSDAKVIVHVHNGHDNGLFRWLFDGLKSNGGKWDVIGMSLYPDKDNWPERNTQCLANIQDMNTRYGSDVMICEVGMSWDEEDAAEAFLTDLIAKCRTVSNEKVLGVFYWEPLAHAGWNGYTLGAFDDNGRATKALNAFFK
ncbi:arabinogalactan endo-1,4-beta-galactosidase [Sphingobacterium alkalisoli]|uniref:Arabinogalactan endo-beta-1,4-galactanase n=1 Tax=Sphingobacterium alkalisoli TaxID=1874115 RepID=A0A4U0GYS4_9SPHI|nr:glycosyl hydrolase 53 family protein [Sphingobacterium alkalisoli]TJY64345.1 arabinogalactan endo-1,4-beta-galactosidase [Sphingobacterium alkalisoli]GGH22294.1 arabinogalactan endo-beta-1,4-galactanase [Sphingobacterium alkalisoli]